MSIDPQKRVKRYFTIGIPCRGRGGGKNLGHWHKQGSGVGVIFEYAHFRGRVRFWSALVD